MFISGVPDALPAGKQRRCLLATYTNVLHATCIAMPCIGQRVDCPSQVKPENYRGLQMVLDEQAESIRVSGTEQT